MFTLLTAGKLFFAKNWKVILEFIAVLVIFTWQAHYFYSWGQMKERENWDQSVGSLIIGVNAALKNLGDTSGKLGDQITDTQALVQVAVGSVLAQLQKNGGLKPLTVDDCKNNKVGDDFVKTWNALNEAAKKGN